MFDSFFVALNAVIPFLCYLLLGYASNAAGVVDEAFLNRLTKLIFTIMFPFMTFYNVYKAEPGNMPSPALMIFCGAAILAVQAVLLLIVPRLVKENRRRGVIIQAVYRSNFVLFGLPLTASIFGAEKTSIAAMLVTVVITIGCILCGDCKCGLFWPCTSAPVVGNDLTIHILADSLCLIVPQFDHPAFGHRKRNAISLRQQLYHIPHTFR